MESLINYAMIKKKPLYYTNVCRKQDELTCEEYSSPPLIRTLHNNRPLNKGQYQVFLPA
jgi:hypothetical protein